MTAFVWFAVHAAWGAELQYPLTAAVDGENTIFVADRFLPGIWRIREGKASIFFQASKRFRTPLNAVRCVAFDGKGRLLAGDSATREVYRFEDEKPVPLTGGEIGIPMGIVADLDDSIYVTDLEIPRIVRIDGEGGMSVLAKVPAPRGLGKSKDGKLLVVSHGKNQLLEVNPADGSVRVVVEGTPFSFPHEVRQAADGTIFVSDGYAKAIWRVGPGGKPAKWIAGPPLQNPVGIALVQERLLIVDPRAKNLFWADNEGRLTPVLK
ncbi:MAG: hypothetical protein D6725_06660 [Planctomycetota bacterium]|nr:MAG: hypothetical protein D6725_06660 [Planctomycetota bacterium]